MDQGICKISILEHPRSRSPNFAWANLVLGKSPLFGQIPSFIRVVLRTPTPSGGVRKLCRAQVGPLIMGHAGVVWAAEIEKPGDRGVSFFEMNPSFFRFSKLDPFIQLSYV